ncbi:MAG: hypothetical protein QOK36_780 [Gaiellales bacterium]|jgi:hypothetical protein|nr:hypothetical protein [Gaiellales bacterium]
MNYEQTKTALEELWHEDVRVEEWTSEPGSHVYVGSGLPIDVALASDPVDVIDPATFESGEWRDQPGADSLWIIHRDRAVSVAP